MLKLFFCLVLLPFLVLCTYEEASSKEDWYYNNAAYCDPDNLSTWKVGRIATVYPQITDIRVYQNTKTDNLAFLGYNPNTQTIILSFRGSRISIQNWIFQDFNFFKTNYPKCSGCQVHQGFYQAYNNLPTATMMSDLKSLKSKYPQAKTVISGHSLGAAMANFAYLDACDFLSQNDLLITYGSPRVGNFKFANFYNLKSCGGGNRIRVTHNRDPVPHLPLQIMGFQHAISEIFYSNEESSTYVYCKNVEDNNCSDQISETQQNPTDHTNYLNFQHVGGEC